MEKTLRPCSERRGRTHVHGKPTEVRACLAQQDSLMANRPAIGLYNIYIKDVNLTNCSRNELFYIFIYITFDPNHLTMYHVARGQATARVSREGDCSTRERKGPNKRLPCLDRRCHGKSNPPLPTPADF